MMSVDPFLSRVYDRKRYNCLHFTRDVWKQLTGVDITDRLVHLMDPDGRVIRREDTTAFARLLRPQDPCLVLMRRPRTAPHAGVYLRGRVLHIHETGVEFQPLDVATRGFESVRFYT